MEPKMFAGILMEAINDGVKKVVVENKLLSDQLTRSDAYRIYGRSIIDRWLREGLIRLIPPSGKLRRPRLNRETLEAIAASSNRTTYLPVTER